MSRYEVTDQEQYAHDSVFGNGDYVGTRDFHYSGLVFESGIEVYVVAANTSSNSEPQFGGLKSIATVCVRGRTE